MRYYLVDSEGNKEQFSLVSTKRISDVQVEFIFSTNDSVMRNVLVKKVAGSYYTSFDSKKWVKVPPQPTTDIYLSTNKVLDLYRGYMPSGLSAAAAGDLVTQMPGKVIKIKAKVGDKVVKGQTLLILEAMKMENEIKAGIDGVVKTIQVSEGQAIDSGVLMMAIEAEV